MKDREICCKYYTCAASPCDKRGIPVSFRHECQTCRYYEPEVGRKPARTDTRKKRKQKAERKEYRDYI